MNEKLITLSKLIENIDWKKEEDGNNVSQLLCSAFNVFGNYNKIMEEFFASLSPQGQENLSLFMCVAAFSLDQNYEAAGRSCWDERKKASEEFAYKNLAYFTSTFKQITGFIPTITDEKMSYYPRAIKEQEWRSWCALLGFASRWENEHSTLKQSVFGGYVRGVLAREYPELDAGFPFI